MKKIKVVFVHHKLVCGGAEQALFDLVNLMDKDKFDITVFTQNPGGAWDLKFAKAGIRVIYDYSCRKTTWSPMGKIRNAVKKIKTDEAYRNEGRGLLDVILEEAPDIVVSYNVWENEELVFAQGAKTIKYIHGDPGTNPDYRAEAQNRQDILRRFDRIVCVSTSAVTAFRELSGIRDTVEMHYNPMKRETVHALAREAIDFPEDAPVICTVGRLSEEKALERLLVIHRDLLGEGIRHRLMIVGDGTDRTYLERLVRAMGVEESVTFAGYQANPYPYMKKSRFLVNSSYTEGLPVIAMEALCLGVPIVAPIPSIGEIFGEETCGIVTENNNESLKAGIRRMLTDEAFYQETKNGAQRRSSFFDGSRMVKEIEEMFLSVLENG